ncbi:hypothetical protein U1Q18_006521, partial [Sarracenia purpurea var. burkii]
RRSNYLMGSWIMSCDKSSKGPTELDEDECKVGGEDASSAMSDDEDDDPFEAVDSFMEDKGDAVL